MAIYTIQQKINIAKVAQYICGNDIEKKGLYGGGQNINLEREIYCCRKDLEFIYNLDNNADGILAVSNYLYALTAPYNLEAANISQSGSGGSVSPINPGAIPDRIDFIVSDNSFIPTGASSKVISQFKGYNIVFARNGQNEPEVDNGGTYFTWNKITALMNIYGVAVEGETFSLIPV